MISMKPSGCALTAERAQSDAKTTLAEQLGFTENWVADCAITLRGSKVPSAGHDRVPQPLSRLFGFQTGAVGSRASGLVMERVDKLVAGNSGYSLALENGAGIWEADLALTPGYGGRRDGSTTSVVGVRSRGSPNGPTWTILEPLVSKPLGRCTVLTANYIPENCLKQQWDRHWSNCKAVGRSATPRYWTVARNIVVGESDTQAEDWLLDRDGSNYLHFASTWQALKRADLGHLAKPDASIGDEDVRVDDLIRGAAIYGSSKTVAAKIIALREESGFFGTLLMALLDGTQLDLEREQLSMQRMAREVMPLIRG